MSRANNPPRRAYVPKVIPENIVAVIYRNRRALRERGLTAADLLFLEAVARHCGDAMKRLSVAAVGRMIGIRRSTALHHARRLQAAGALVRVQSAMMVNVRSVLSWAADAVKTHLEHAKRLFSLRYSQRVSTCLTHGSKEKKEGLGGWLAPSPTFDSGMDRHSALAELAASYVPVHLRASARSG